MPVDVLRSPRDKMRGLVSEADKNYERDASPNERIAVNASRAAAKKTEAETAKAAGLAANSGEIRADYKIEVHFGAKRTSTGPNLLGLKMWESGKKFHGGGDENMFWCKDTTPGSTAGCGMPIPSSQVRGQVAFCTNCQKGILASKISDIIVHRITTQNLAILVEKLFRDLGSNADIYCKYDASDIRYIAVQRDKGSRFARKNRGKFIYPLKNILRDTSAGASLQKRLYALFSA